jgi:carbon-monoxide dehydrogenase large subunit
MATVERVLGKAIKRKEDPRFITGKGNYVDDVKLPGATWAAFVRSPHASARIRSIDTSKAKQHPGVVAVYTGADMTGVNSLPCGWDLRKEKKIPGVVQDLAMVPHMPLSSDAARHVGDPVAVVIAETQSAATDAAEKVVVDWDVQKSVTDTQRATTAGAPRCTPARPATSPSSGSSAMRRPPRRPSRALRLLLESASSINDWWPTPWSRACAAPLRRRHRRADAVTSQNPHVHRLLMCAFVLGIPEHKVRVIAPDVGGGFGSKIFLYNEEVVCSWASRLLKRPVRWTSSRHEAYLTDAHGRDHVTDAEMAMSADGKILALRVTTAANLGAYLSTFAPAVPTSSTARCSTACTRSGPSTSR